MNRTKKNNEQNLVRDFGTAIMISLFMIILTFFILLNSMAIVEQNKKRDAIKSLAGSFGSSKDNTFSSPHSKADRKKNLEKLIAVMSENEHKDLGIKAGINREILTIGEKALFYQNSYMLKPESFALLKKVGNFINQGDFPVLVIGHTDNRDAQEKGYASNWELSCLMAIQLQKYFIEECKVKPSRVTAYGNGSQQPEASNDTPESRQKNRRIEVIFDSSLPVTRVYNELPSGNFTYKRFNFNVYQYEKKQN